MQGFSIMNAPAPQLLRDYLIYLSTIKGRSPRTVEAYYNDLRLFLRYMMATDEIATDVGTVVYGREAVDSGLMDEIGSLSDAFACLHRQIARVHRKKEKDTAD